MNQVTRNIDFILGVLYGNQPIKAEALNEFFVTVFNLLSEQKCSPAKNFQSLYYSLFMEDRLYPYDIYSNFIMEAYPMLSDLLGAYFESVLFDKPLAFNLFSYRSPPSDSFMTEETAFGLYLTNSLLSTKKNMRLFPLFSSHNSSHANSDALSEIKSNEVETY